MDKIESLKREARSVVASFNSGDDFDGAVCRLAAIGYALEDALGEVC